MNTITLATIYESQGLKNEALEVYKNILKEDPNNAEAKIAVKRLGGFRRKFPSINEEMRNFFINMDSDIEFLEFERWLLKIWK